MGQLELLWEYQQSDVEVYNLNRLIKRSPKRMKLLKLRDSLKEQQALLKSIEDEVLAMVDRSDALKDAVSLMEVPRAYDQDPAYDGGSAQAAAGTHPGKSCRQQHGCAGVHG